MRNLRCSPWSTAGWRRDERDRLILMRVPAEIDLEAAAGPHIQYPVDNHGNEEALQTTPARPQSRHTASLTSLPAELIHEIAWHLHPVDRVCLALTCKTLTKHILSAPLLSPMNWSRFSSDWRYGILPVPESYSLILRLAHGWVPKDNFRYCWRCHKIRPRDEAYFRGKMSCKKNPRWSVKVAMDKDVWDTMSKKARYAFLIDDWCNTSAEDSSHLYCDFCRGKAIRTRDDFVISHRHHPVQCPECLEKELTFIWRPPPRQPWILMKTERLCRAVYRACKWVVWFLIWCCEAGVKFACRTCSRCWRRLRD